MNQKESIFEAYAQYYDLLYQEKSYEQEVAYVTSLINRYAPQATTVLDLGCGTGKHALGFAQHGYSVQGVDLSAHMINQAQQLKQQHPQYVSYLTFEVGDARTFQVPQTFDVVVSLFHVFSYQTTQSDIMQFLKTITSHLKPGGLVIFDCWYGPAILHQGVDVRVKRVEGDGIMLLRLTEPTLLTDRNIVAIDFTLAITDVAGVRMIHECHQMRYFFRPELELLCQLAGIELLGLETLVSAQQPGLTTRDVCIIGRKL